MQCLSWSCQRRRRLDPVSVWDIEAGSARHASTAGGLIFRQISSILICDQRHSACVCCWCIARPFRRASPGGRAFIPKKHASHKGIRPDLDRLDPFRTKKEHAAHVAAPFLIHPHIIVRVSCSRCPRAGAYRLARLAERYGAEITIAEPVEKLSADCPHRTIKRFKGATKYAAPACPIWGDSLTPIPRNHRSHRNHQPHRRHRRPAATRRAPGRTRAGCRRAPPDRRSGRRR